MNRFTLFAIAAGMSAVAFGQGSFTLGTAKSETSEGLVSRSQNVQMTIRNNYEDAFALNNAQKTNLMDNARLIKVPRKAENLYGTVVEIMYEDFSKMSTGSIESPDRDTQINEYVPGGVYWWNVKPEYTTLPNWGSHYAYPAGGCLFMDADNEEGAQLNTPLIDVSGRCRIAFLQFKARTLTGTATGLLVEAAETKNMSPTGWEFMGPVEIPQITDEWQTYEVMFKGTGPSTMFNFVQKPTSQIYIDDIRVYQIDQYVNTPVTLPHNNYTGSTFTANWEAVNGAESYLLNVYSLNEAKQPNYLLKDKKVTGTSFVVEGITSGETYYYTLRAVKGTHESIETLPVEVFDLEAPVLSPTSEVKQAKYTAEWNNVPSAERYNYCAYNVRTAEADGEFVVTDENFDGVRDANGELTGLTIENPSYNVYSELYLADLSQAGWKGSNYMPYTDYICVDGWQYMNGQGDAGLISPELDMSKDDGKFNLSIKLYGEIANLYDEDGNPIPTQTECAVALFNYDEAIGDYVQSELIYPKGVAAEWKTFNVNLTKGTKRTKIGIYAVKAPGNLYMDDLKITQNYKKGESLMEPFFFARWHENTSIDVQLPVKVFVSPIYHKVNAVKSKDGNKSGGAKYRESAYSNLERVTNEVSSVNDNMLCEKPNVTVSDRALIIANPQCNEIIVYAVDGTQVYADNSGQRNIIVTPSGRGVYVVKIGDTVLKVRN